MKTDNDFFKIKENVSLAKVLLIKYYDKYQKYPSYKAAKSLFKLNGLDWLVVKKEQYENIVSDEKIKSMIVFKLENKLTEEIEVSFFYFFYLLKQT